MLDQSNSAKVGGPRQHLSGPRNGPHRWVTGRLAGVRLCMALSLSHEGDIALLEGDPEETLMLQVEDANRVLETCFSLTASRVLLYARNVTPQFFDLSSGEAGAILQKLRNYGVQLALVCPAGPIRFSTRFAEMVAEERRGQHFAVFETREAARAWLARGASPHEA